MTEKTVRIVTVTNLDDGTALERLRADRRAFAEHVKQHHKPAPLDAERPLREVLDENRARIADIIEREREQPPA